MHMRSSFALALVTVSIAACGGSKPPTDTHPTSPPADTTAASTTGQVKLGHFSTADGRHGFVLDRTGAKAKLKVDGTNDVIELTEEEVRTRGGLDGYRLVDPSNKPRLFLSPGGLLTYFVGTDELRVTNDRDAAPLGAATIAGAPKKSEAPWKAQSDALAAQSVMKRFPEFKLEDASRLDKIAEAYAKADKAMFVHYVKNDKDGFPPKITFGPSNASSPAFGRQNWATDEKEEAKHKKLAVYGARTRGYSDAQSMGNHVIVDRTDTPPLASGTPGLIWEVDDNSVILVTFDGGRYDVNLNAFNSAGEKGSPIEAGTGPSSGWPKEVQDPFLDYTAVGMLGNFDPAAKTVRTELEKIDGAWNACAQRVWKPANAKIEIGRFTLQDAKGFAVKTQATCRGELDRFETTLVTFIDKRKAERTALLQKTKAHAGELGLGK
ncbi:MAG: hypothetical protein FWD69_09425 [Polyangiaceae bacterium]|nr:hypothetical protein [Polyangiaceae bacterium]